MGSLKEVLRMAKRVVGLDIGSSAVRAVELSLGSSHPTLLAFGQVSLARGAVVDGEVAEPRAVSDAIRRLWKQGRFRQTRVHVSIAGLRAITRELDMPAVPPEEMDNAVRFQSNELIPFPPEQTVLSSQILEDFVGPNGEGMRRVLVAAAHQDLLTKVVSAILDAGLFPINIDLASSALIRAVVGANYRPLEVPDVPEAVVSIGAGITIVVVHRRGRPEFVRTIGQGGNAVTDAISSILGVPVPDAEVLKRRLGEPFPELAQVEAATKEPTGSLVNEIRGSLDYYASLPNHEPVHRVNLTGAGSILLGLRDRLQAQVRVPVVYASPLAQLDLSKMDLDESEIALMDTVLATPVGTALPEVATNTKKFNLLPAEVGQRMREKALRQRLILSAAAVVALMAVGLGARLLQVHDAQHNVNAANQSIAQLNAQITRYNDVVSTRQQIKNDQNRIMSVISGEISWPTVMNELSQNIPSNVYLTSFNGNALASAGSSSTTTPGSTAPASTAAVSSGASVPAPNATLATITVSGSGQAFGGGADWITQMNSSPVFADTFVTSISQATQGGAAVTFSSTLQVTGAARSTRLSNFSGSVQ